MTPIFAFAQNARDLLDRSQARSMVITRRGIVATSQALASQAGAQILARGGSAVSGVNEHESGFRGALVRLCFNLPVLCAKMSRPR